jgi:hypothetical protein
MASVSRLLNTCPGSTYQQLVANAGFEAPTLSHGPSGPPPVSVGNWLANTGYAAVIQVGRPQPVHSGRLAASVQTTAGSSGGYWLQDFPTFLSSSTYLLSVWVYPTFGSQTIELITAWDRSAGNGNTDTSVALTPSGTVFSGWGQTVTVPAVTYGRWHHLVVLALPCQLTQILYLDGATPVVLAHGTLPANAPATLLLGYPNGYAQDDTHFYYDDVTLLSSIPYRMRHV